MAPPVSTYRLQLTANFGFAAAGAQAAYLASLGVSHVYLSPVLQAAPGSVHGYDVTDHSRISSELGGEAGFRAMAERFRHHGLGIVLDIVPNHMGVPVPESLNRQLWEVLRDGPGSRYAHWFDIDWPVGGGKMLLPLLGEPLSLGGNDPPQTPLALGWLPAPQTPWGTPFGGPGNARIPVLRYYDHVLPLRAGTEGLPLPELLDAQHYRLAFWREAEPKLNWRRFFDVNSLIGIRVEDPDVFDATHEVVLRLVNEGLVDGLRIDHPDGLADPRGYLRRLAAAVGDTWVVVEKILDHAERIPGDWPCAGTTGYDALRVVDGLFVDPAGGGPPFAEMAVRAKREIASGVLAAEVTRLARLLVRIRPDTDLEDVRTVLIEVLAAFPVYRAYVHPGEPPSSEARLQVREAVAAAKRELPESLRELAGTVGDLALNGPGFGEAPGTGAPAEFMVRFGQTTDPVLAKGVEDTAGYRWPGLLGRMEVGGDPDRFAVSPAEFHAFASDLAADWPSTMTTLSTHDTKRQEDVRARLAVLSEIPGDWSSLRQTLVGAWPLSVDRLRTYLVKAMREAKTRTSWLAVDSEYEETVLRAGTLALTDGPRRESIEKFVASIAPDADANSLGAKLVQLTMPGVPDIYQGCELTALSLVDPDNRRPVDFARRRELLESPSPPVKLLVTTRALRLRREHPEWFLDGDYEPLFASGPAAEHVVAFVRGGRAVTVATRLPRRLRERGGWGETVLELPPGPGTWRDVLTGQPSVVGDTVVGDTVIHVKLIELLQHLPVALLSAE